MDGNISQDGKSDISEDIIPRKGGTYSPIHEVHIDGQGPTMLVKQIGYEPSASDVHFNNPYQRLTYGPAVRLWNDMTVYRRELSGYVNVPKVYSYGFEPDHLLYDEVANYAVCGNQSISGFIQADPTTCRIVTLEEYTGRSLRDLIREGIANERLDINFIEGLKTNILDILGRIPQTVGIDANPANFTYNQKDGEIYFVDFAPPFIYESLSQMRRTPYAHIFHTLEERGDRPDSDREYQYNTAEGRRGRFMWWYDKTLRGKAN